MAGRILKGLLALALIGWLIVVPRIITVGRRDGARPAAAIVVLGAAQYEGRPSPVLRARLDHALELWRRDLAPRLILTGGRGEGDTTSEAAVGRRYMINRGVPGRAIRVEDRGKTTSQSLHSVAKMMDEYSANSVILVSDPFHMFRLSILAKRLGLEPYTSPTRTSPIGNSSQQWKYVLSESVKAPLAFLMERKGEGR
ncbi:MAG TPA: YdcF family protein [Gemmatimonadaceae bacterium]|nr:YdcF family protein [Gemmatimonadaceae bacterium]